MQETLVRPVYVPCTAPGSAWTRRARAHRPPGRASRGSKIADGPSNNVSAGGCTGTAQGAGLQVSSVKVTKSKQVTAVEVDNTPLTGVPSEFSDITAISSKAVIDIVAATAI